ncbi:hypothetical protein C8F04DRAFT_1172520 [Mycena alexandri]|uniref:Homeobox domain-containing protein n=1 Tax=Mycena alexandri TaxID=1745969 RepID=A0AAD6TJU2_9AGAR|nr:hypothetical protein C8F04DRAFT_1172520 [Mycena alexandri]
MTKRAAAKAQPEDTGTTSTQTTDTTPALTGRLQPVHFDELYAIWPADPRLPSVDSRRAWALARNVTPTYVHNWFNRRRPVAKRLRLTIPKETYELPVGTPPVVIVKDEPVESELPATINEDASVQSTSRSAKVTIDPNVAPVPAATRQRKKKVKTPAPVPVDSAAAESEPMKSLKRKRNDHIDLPSHDLSEPTQPKNKKTVVPVPVPSVPSDDATSQPKPKQSRQRRSAVKVEPIDAAVPSAPKKQPKKRTTKPDPGPASTNGTAEAAPPAKRSLKRPQNTEVEPTHDDAPQPQKKIKISAPIHEPIEPSRKKKTVRFDSHNPDTPPSSSPTMRASSLPPSDAATAVDDTPASSLSPKTATGGAHIKETSIPDPRRSTDLVEDDGPLSPKRTNKHPAKAKENKRPLKSALKETRPRRKPKAKATPTPVPIAEEEEVVVCDRGNKHAPTGFTCALCGPSTDDATEGATADVDIVSDSPKQDFNWTFQFSSFTGPMGDYTDICVDLTPLSAVPFLATPIGSLAAEPSYSNDGGLTLDDDGYMHIDNLRFTYDGTYVGEEGAGEFFPALPTDWKPLVALAMDSAGEWIRSDGEEVSDDDVGDEICLDVEGLLDSSPNLRLPADIS